MAALLVFAHFVSVIFSVRAGYVPVYGFEGATTALESGKTLHYYIRLNRCTHRSGRGHAEYTEPFGSHVTKWRTVNDQNRTDLPYLLFHEQIPVLNRAGRLESLSRDIKIWINNSVLITTTAYSPDYSLMSYEYTHECSLSTSSVPGNIDFRASSTQPIRLNSFDQITSSLEAGEYLHFNAMTFQCPGGSEHTFSGLGGHIPNYEFVYDNSGVISNIKVFVQTTVHYGLMSNYANVIDMSISRNISVTFLETRNSLPNYIPISEHVTRCPLNIGQDGGMVSVYI